MAANQSPSGTRSKVSLLCKYKLVLKEDKPRQVTPSVYAKEILQSTEERLANTTEIHLPRILDRLDLSNTTHHKLSLMDRDQPLFQPYPSELVFQNFTPAQTYQLCLLLVNNDTVSRHLMLELQNSKYFHVDGPKDTGSKVAAGMTASFTVSFTPQENKDYHHRLVFVTERERFEVPVRAIGPRAILDFHDEVHLPVCPVKASTERTHLVRNIGNSEAKFTLLTESPFSVTPSSGTLSVDESMQVTVVFNPTSIENFKRVLYLKYNTGEVLHINLYGSCMALNIHLEHDSVLLKKTYISLANVHTVSLTNRSDIILQYCWTTWPSLQEEALSYLRGSTELRQKEQLHFQCESHPTAFHGFPLLSRILQERRSQAVEDNLLVLSNGCITVEPAEGEIWPNMTVQFNIVFKPEEAKLYQQTIYCDVTGCESRLPLTIKGEGMGPTLQLSYNLMDMKNVFIGDKDCYEVLVSNKGLIDAPFRLSTPDTTFGRCFNLSLEEGVVPSGACQRVKISFCSHILGTFSEDLLLTVTGQPQPLILTVRGCVIGPTFHFDVTEFNFGDVAFGFPQTLKCTLFNTSFVPMNFALRVLGDGLGSPSVTCDKQVSDLSMNNWQFSAAKDLHEQPVEFTISPAAGSMCAMSDVTIKVTLCSNTVRTYSLELVVDVEGVGKEVMTLPVSARCVPVPDIVVETPVLDFERCFLNQPYEQNVRLINTSTLPVCYGMLDQVYAESMIFGSSKPRGVIPPHSSEVLPVVLRAEATGRLHHDLRIAVFGSAQPPLVVVLSCMGQGPVVCLQSQQLDFGTIPVLTDITRTLQVSNESPIPAHFTARMSHGTPFRHVEPSEGVVPPQSQLELRVVAHLKDTLLFQARLEISIWDSLTYTVPLSATGTGTTIVSDRPFAPNLELGTYLSHETCQYNFKLTNRGQRVHRMYWRTDGFLPSTKTRKGGNLSGRTILPPISAPGKKDVPARGSSSSGEKPVFSLTPFRVELFPGCSADMVLTGSSDSPKVVQERLVCDGVVGRCGRNEHIMSVNVTCRFVAPKITPSSNQLNFYIEKVPGMSLMPLYEKLVLLNASSLFLSLELSLEEPFFLCEAPGAQSSATTKSMVLEDGREAELWVGFTPPLHHNQVSQVVDELLTVSCNDHPQQTNVRLHAEVHFPNLHFSCTSVDFGCTLNDTESCKQISMRNCSRLPVLYSWAFWEDATRETKMMEAEEDAGGPRPGANEQCSTQCPVSVKEVFDILPLHGHLQPGNQQLVTFSFYGHKNVSREVVALCYVEEGPTYEVKLRGEASVISYSLDPTHVDFGLQLFDHVREAEFTLRNTGKIGFKFNILPQREDEVSGAHRKSLEEQPGAWQHDQNEEGQEVIPGWPMVIPSTGFVDARAQQCLRVFYLPGIPGVYRKQFQLKVAFLAPQDVTLSGVGVYPRICLNLPQNLSDEGYSDVVQQARAAVEADRVTEQLMNDEGAEASCTLTYEELLHLEVERALVKENALAVTGSLLVLREAQGSSRKWHKLSKFLLPEYVLNFGYAIPGKVLSHTVELTNPGPVDVSFHANCKPLAGTGFSAEFEKVNNLPCGKTLTFTVKFDPQGAKLKMGDTSVVMPIQVKSGPVVQVRLCAVVTVPAITVSTDTLQFDTMQCGMCQMMTAQLFNHGSVICSWSVVEEVKPKKVDKFPPRHQLTKDLREQRPTPAVFKMIPSSGVLSPGERVNVQIKFSPAEGRAYKRQLVVHVAESTQQVFITAQGQGEEPQLLFCPSVLELGPCLPGSAQIEAEVTVKNPCSFPIEFYSLEFDTQYLEEDKILRLMQGYDEDNILLLPPRAPGESLPTELLDYYKEYGSQLRDDAKLHQGLGETESGIGDTREEERRSRQNNQSPDSKDEGIHTIGLTPAELLISEMTKEGNIRRLGQLEMTPVSRAIARYMCIDVTPEGLAAHNRRGIAITVYGAPLTAKSSTAAALAHYYGGACLSVDAVVTDVLINGTSSVSLTAKQLYDYAAAEYAKKKAEEAGHLEASDPASPDTVDVIVKPSEDSCSWNDSEAPQKTASTHFALCLGGDPTTVSNLLPEQLLVDILAERFQLSDCHHSIVIDGLESVYTLSAASTLQVVLKALNNRKHIYVVDLCDSYAALKERERAQRETEEALQREKADREMQWLEELEDWEYDALSEEEEERIVRQHKEMLRQQKLRELEQIAREQEEKRHQEELKVLTEKESKKTSKRMEEHRDGKILLEEKQSRDGLNGRRMSSYNSSKESLVDAREQHNLKEVHHSKEADDLHKQTEHAESPQPTDKPEEDKSSVDVLQSQFSAYEHSQELVEHILQHWDRAQGLLLVPLPSEEGPPDKQASPGKRSRKAKSVSKMPSQMAAPAEADKAFPQDIIPHIVLTETGKDCPSITELLKGSILPPLVKVLDDLGLGPSGPPILPPTTFSMVPYPKARKQPMDERGEEKKQEDVKASVVKAEAAAAPSKSCVEGSVKESEVRKDSAKKGRQGQKKKRQTSAKTKAKGSDRVHALVLKVSSTSNSTKQRQRNVKLKPNQSLKTFRWVVPANGEAVLRVSFYSNSPGRFDETFSFQLLGSQLPTYKLRCRGTCTQPAVSMDPMSNDIV